MAEMEKPSLSREIGRVAWLLTKVLVPTAVFTGLLFFFLRNHPVIALCIWCGLLVVGQIVYGGWQSYQWKKSDWKRREQEELERQWRASQERLLEDQN